MEAECREDFRGNIDRLITKYLGVHPDHPHYSQIRENILHMYDLGDIRSSDDLAWYGQISGLKRYQV